MLVNLPQDDDWIGLRQCLAQLAGIRLDYGSDAVFGTVSANLIAVVSADISSLSCISATISSLTASTASLTDFTATIGIITTLATGSATVSRLTANYGVFGDAIISTPADIYNLSHDSFTDFVVLEHIDHSGVLVTANAPLSGGGSITASRTFNLSYTTTLTVTSSYLHVDDTALSHDNLAAVHQAVTTTATPTFAHLNVENTSYARFQIRNGPASSAVALTADANTTAQGYSAIFAYDFGNSAVRDIVLQEKGGNIGIKVFSPATMLHAASVVRTDEHFDVNGSAGLTTTVIMAAGTVLTFTGGILTQVNT